MGDAPAHKLEAQASGSVSLFLIYFAASIAVRHLPSPPHFSQSLTSSSGGASAMSTSCSYVLDADVFITAKNKYYAFAI